MRFYQVSLDDPSFPSLYPKGEIVTNLLYWLIPERLIPRDADKIPTYPLVRLSDIPSNEISFPLLNEKFQVNDKLRNVLYGRRLLVDEITAHVSLDVIHEHVCHGVIHYQPAITRNPKLTCRRCGNDDPFLFGDISCARCKKMCAYCRACLMMGRVAECSPLLTWNEKEKAKEKRHTLGWKGQLSPAQSKASQALVNHVTTRYKTEKNFLIWAVCGAGKTEMLFAAIQLALTKGGPVLVATPRTDVVLELLPRMTEAFPHTVVRAFHGGVPKEERFEQGELVIATTHQLLRFYRHFPLVIIDEVDAFPYSYDKKLQYAVKNARAKESLTVYVTATPPDNLKRKAASGKIAYVKVLRRYHGHDLPVPKQTWIGNWKKKLLKGNLPNPVIEWLRGHIANQKQVFLFVPQISLMEKIEEAVRIACETVNVETVHAADPSRREKVIRFREGETNVLVTTTILERGVTVKGVQVGILGAEDRIFTESALVQISGRVGRSPDRPSGDVVFFHYGKTKAMGQAIRHIEMMNKDR
ncbi:DEAD/DEAH box helicase [Salipaludibacillus daqingensis]|uniref:DEAD/DEAH box helicase n=1 Tax=Salipaludibacillus daqingensis TaxID=3041001 RepID=UPI002475D712|nr:DEAD/DEAH box helicase [Salipaludibacillus daqingensis]